MEEINDLEYIPPLQRLKEKEKEEVFVPEPPPGREQLQMHPIRQKPTTPVEILSILNTIEKRGRKNLKFAEIKGGGNASTVRKLAKEANSTFRNFNKGSHQSISKSNWRPVKTRKQILAKDPHFEPSHKPLVDLVEPHMPNQLLNHPKLPVGSGHRPVTATFGLSPLNIMKMLGT